MMNKQTPAFYKNQVMYSIYVRSHTPEGTFKAIEGDLDRIRALGTDIVWLMPIHPIGEEKKKGIGCPYAIKDYRAVNPDYGRMADFEHLVGEIHRRGMKCIIDVVYNHTSPDNKLAAAHPEWYYHKPDGSFGNKTADWTDIIDLDYSSGRALWDYQIETLAMWAEIVDGFRCDVASLVPVEFWREARAAVEKVRPGALWLAESVEDGFIVEVREAGFAAHSDCELFGAFDVCYDYDIKRFYDGYLRGELPLERYVEAIEAQEYIYTADYVKLRFLENHDQTRAAELFPDPARRRSWTVFYYLLKGMPLIYAGQEFSDSHKPSLFAKECISRDTEHDLSPLFRKLYEIKKLPVITHGRFRIEAQGDAAVMTYEDKTAVLTVACPLGEVQDYTVTLGLSDGDYVNLLDGGVVGVSGGVCSVGAPVVLLLEKE